MKLKLTHTSPLHPSKNKQMHTPHHTIPFLSSVLTTAVQVLNERHDTDSLFLCPPLPHDRWRRETQQSLSFFSSSKNSTIVVCSCHLLLLLLLLWTTDSRQWPIQNRPCVSSCARHRRRGRDKREVPVLLQQRLSTSGWLISFFQRLLFNYN